MGFAVSLLQFTPKVATCRLLQEQCSRQCKEGWVSGVGMRPRLWRNRLGAEAPQDGLQEMEAAQKRSFQQMQQSSEAPGNRSSSSSDSQRFSDAAMMAAYHASWMDPSRERELPRQRAATAAAVVTAQRQQQEQQQQRISCPAHNDLLDPITQSMGAVNARQHRWVASYQRLKDTQLPRRLRVFGWRLLHAGVKVGARRMLASSRRAPAHFTCPAQQCQQPQQLETLTHLLVECPVAAAAWQWYAQQVWQRVQPGAVVPVNNSRLLLLDDFSVWAPPAGQQQMWTQLRLLLLESIWVVRCSSIRAGVTVASADASDGSGSHNAGSNSQSQSHNNSDAEDSSSSSSSSSMDSQRGTAGEPGSSSYAAKAVACRFLAELRQQIQREWDRVEVDVRIGCGIPFAWLQGRSPEIKLVDFEQKWGALYRMGANGRIKVRASAAGM